MNSRNLSTVFLFILLLLCPVILSQNLKVNGYRGIWYEDVTSANSFSRFSGGVATFASRHRPVSVFSPEVNKTFFVYGGTTEADERHLLIMISYYDHTSHLVPRPVIVYDKMGVREPHDNASLSIDRQGYLWVFVSGNRRTRPGIIFRSESPWSIDKFEKVLEWEMTSPQPWIMPDNGFLLMFSRATDGRELYWSTSYDGRNWSECNKLAGMGGHYQVSGVYGNTLMTVFDYHPGGDPDKRTNIYLLQTENFGKTWKTIDGDPVETPLTDPGSAALVMDFESEGKRVFINDLTFDAGGNPVILAATGIPGEPVEWVVLCRREGRWDSSSICTSDHFYDKGFLDITGREWRMTGSTEPGPYKETAGGELALWISSDEGKSWKKAVDVTHGSRYNNSFVRATLNYGKDFFALWVDGDPEKLSESRLYFTNEKCDKVWCLPYNMKREFGKPVRIR